MQAPQLDWSYIVLIIPGTRESERESILQLASCELSFSLARIRKETLDFVLEDDQENWGRSGDFK